MPTPKKRYHYTFLYTDGTYLTYELTREDYAKLETNLTSENRSTFVAVSIGIIATEGIRSIIEQKEQEPVEELEINESELPVLDQESYNWIKQYMGGKD